MPTLLDYTRRMLRYDRSLGFAAPISALAAQTATIGTTHNMGTLDASSFVGKWMVRRNAAGAPADRVRLCSSFAFSSNLAVLTHAGLAYADTTGTLEYLEVWNHDPYAVDNAVQLALSMLRQEDRDELPTVSGQEMYPLSDLSWVVGPSDIVRVTRRKTPVVSKDRWLEKWNTVNSSGVLTPDYYSATNATPSRDTATKRRGRHSVSLTRAGSDVTFSQTVNLLDTGVSGEDLRGVELTIVAVVKAGASGVSIDATDGTTTATADTHTGGGAWEELTTTITPATAATSLTVRFKIATNNQTAYLNEFYVVPTASFGDSVRRDRFDEVPVTNWRLETRTGQCDLVLPAVQRGSQYVVYSLRPFPEFDEAGFLAGQADTNSLDAPEDLVAVKAIALLYEALADEPGVDTTDFRRKAVRWGMDADTLQTQYLYREDRWWGRGGIEIPRVPLGPPAYRGPR